MKKAAFVLLITAIVLSFLCYGCNKKDNSAITPGVDDSSLGVELPETVDNDELRQLNDIIVNTYRVDNLKYSITTNGTEAAVVYEKYGKNEYLSVNGESEYADGSLRYYTEAGRKQSVYYGSRIYPVYTAPGNRKCKGLTKTDYGFRAVYTGRYPEEIVEYELFVLGEIPSEIYFDYYVDVQQERLSRVEATVAAIVNGKEKRMNFSIAYDESDGVEMPSFKEYPLVLHYASGFKTNAGFAFNSELRWFRIAPNTAKNTVVAFFDQAIIEIDCKTDEVVGRYPVKGQVSCVYSSAGKIYVSYEQQTYLDVYDGNTMTCMRINTERPIEKFLALNGKIFYSVNYVGYVLDLASGEVTELNALNQYSVDISEEFCSVSDEYNLFAMPVAFHAINGYQKLYLYNAETGEEKFVDFYTTGGVWFKDDKIASDKCVYDINSGRLISVTSPTYGTLVKGNYLDGSFAFEGLVEYIEADGYIITDVGVFNTQTERWENIVGEVYATNVFAVGGKVYYTYSNGNNMVLDYAGNTGSKQIEVYSGKKPAVTVSPYDYGVETGISANGYTAVAAADGMIFVSDGNNLNLYDSNFVLTEIFAVSEPIRSLYNANGVIYASTGTNIYKYEKTQGALSGKLEHYCTLPREDYLLKFFVNNDRVYYCCYNNGKQKLVCYDIGTETVIEGEASLINMSTFDLAFEGEKVYARIKDIEYNSNRMYVLTEDLNIVIKGDFRGVTALSFSPIYKAGEMLYCGKYTFDEDLENYGTVNGDIRGFSNEYFVTENGIFDYDGSAIVLFDWSFKGLAVYDAVNNRFYLCTLTVYSIDMDNYI